jgi:pyruvate dehydrogenase E2 component (dihydrolipoamide acetyltransferase)
VKVRKQIATAMVSSAFTAPHVSLFVDVDAKSAPWSS